ncbi:hypothetical protein ACHAXM_007810 [Skeletonema potamos]
MSGRGRGRGRGSTLPAWMTNPNNASDNNDGNDDRYSSSNSGGQPVLGYYHDTADPWERDNRGRRDDNMNNVNNGFVREEIRGDNTVVGMGRGRGRGRGIHNRSTAWRDTSTGNDGPSGQFTSDNAAATATNSKTDTVSDEAMGLLLAQARQKREEQQQQQQQQLKQNTNTQTNTSTTATSSSSSDQGKESSNNKDTRMKTKAELQQEEKQKIEDDAKEAARKLEEESRRLEQLARKLREERRRKLRRLEQTNEVKVEGEVIQSEQVITTAYQNKDISPNKMEVDTNNNVGDNHDKLQVENNSDDDSFDMFATTDNATPIPTHHSKNAMSTANNASDTAQECDDAEGYYKANIGEIITLPREIGADDIVRFRVLGIIGKGVFSSVIKCVEENVNGTQQDIASSRVVAMKIIRNNEVMARAAAKEMRILRMLCSSSRAKAKGKTSKKERDNNDDDDDELDKEEQLRLELENHNIVRLLEVDGETSSSSSHDALGSNGDSKAFSAPPPEYRSHCIFLFEYLPHNLREVLNKFGKNVGINLTAVKSYARQLLCALRHLEKHRIVHSDIKPDNILVSANFSTLKICDFGSAFFETDHDNDPTPYMVSRFYRPPEVILGLEYDRMVDLWSVGVTISELYTGSVLFPGNSNNDMLKKFMDTMGPFSFKMVRRHNKSYERMGLQPHFEIGNTGGTYEFRKQDVDKVTGQPILRIVNVLTAKTEASLAQVLLKASSKGGVSERVEVLKFASFLQRCLALDPARRLSVRDALQHEFFQKKKAKEENA